MNSKDAFIGEAYRYLDDELSPEDTLAFEQRIDSDEALEREFRAIAEIDLLETLGGPVGALSGAAKTSG